MRTVVYEIPVEPRPLTMGINIHGSVYRLRTQYRDMGEGGWVLDIENSPELEKDRFFLEGIPLVAGLDLLYQYQNFKFNFALLILCKEGRTTPSFESLGVEDKLVIVVRATEEELALFGIGDQEFDRRSGWEWPIVQNVVTIVRPWILWGNNWDDQGVWYDSMVWR